MKHIGEYIITQSNIAKGAFAYIHKGEHKYSHLPVAIKEIKVQNVNNLKKYVIRELEIHKKLNHHNIVKLYDIIIISNPDNAVYMIMEYCELGDLQKFQNKKPFSEKYIQQYMIQLRDALKYLYDNNIVHRDLKPQNILLTNSLHIKITDFGLARNTIQSNFKEDDTEKEIEQELFSTYCGSPIYMSPELLNKQNYNSKSDLWSVGVILYELITGTPPYIAKNITQLINKVNYEPINLDKIDKKIISPECFDLLTKLLHNDKHSRMDWKSFFNHQWFDINNNILINNDRILLENPLDYDNIDKINIPIFRNLITKEPQSNSYNNKIDNNKLDDNILDDKLDISKSSISKSSINYSYEKLCFSDTFKKNKIPNIDDKSSKSVPIMLAKFDNNKSNKNNLSSKSLIKSKNKFTFNLRSSEFNDDINLSDLEQDDLPEYYSKKNSSNNIYQQQTSNNNTSTPKYSSTNNQSNSRTPEIYTNNSTNKYKTNNNSPSSITHAIKFIKETYDYLNNDNKTL
jgi:serine/threonine protein kinase